MDTRGTSAQAAFPQVNPHFQALVSPPTAEPGTSRVPRGTIDRMGDPKDRDPTARARVAIGAGVAFMAVAGWFLVAWPIGPDDPPPTLEDLVRECDDEAMRVRLMDEGQEWSIGDSWTVSAVGCGTDMVRYALDAGASPDATANDAGWSALHEATDEGEIETVRLLLARGADPNVHSERGTPLLIASFDGRAEMASTLLDGAALVDGEDPHGWTPLVAAGSIGDAELAEILLERGADIDHRTKAGDTALLQAATNAHAPVVDLLLSSGADPSIPSDRGHTPLFRAVAAGDLEVAEALLEAGASPDVPARVTYRELLLPLLGRSGGVVDPAVELNHLVETLGGPLGLDVEVMEAARDGEFGEYDTPTEHRLDEEVGTFTPLYAAVVLDEPEIVSLLLEHGADSELGEITSGHRPADAADLLGRDSLALLVQAS